MTHLERLEAESIHIIREVAAECENPVMLYSIGKDSAVMLHLAMKAFYPAKPPFPLMHVDTTWKFRDMIAFRDRDRRQARPRPHRPYQSRRHRPRTINPFDHGSALHTQIMKTDALKQALDKYGFDAAFGGARRDEEKSRAKERIFSFRDARHRWDPKNQRPELWNLYNARKNKGESIRVFPLSNWTELDIWQYIFLENIPIVPLYFAKQRPVVMRDGQMIMVDDERMPLHPGEKPEMQDDPLPHARLLSLDRRHRIHCRDTSRHHPGNAGDHLLRAPGPRHRQGSGRFDGEEEAGGIFLMSRFIEFQGGDVEAYLRAQEEKDLLRFITCGSVDDGKSTLIGRLLYEAKMLFEDQLSALEADSKQVGTQGGALDFALLVDGLAAEREQGITIDVAYRAFTTDKRKFIVADTPGHEQYTRNMATGASTADLAVILIDARKGVLTQTRRHTFIATLLGIKNICRRRQQDGSHGLSPATCSRRSRRTIAPSPRDLGIEDFTCIPMSALKGDNVIEPSEAMPWYHGPTLMAHLETVPVGDETGDRRLPPAGAMGQPARPVFPRLFRHHRRRPSEARR